MTKEELLTALREKLGTTSNLSERTLDTFSEQMATAMGSDFSMTDSFVDSQVGILKSVGGQLSHDISAGIEDWKKKNPIVPPQQQQQQDDGNQSELSKLMEKLNGIEERLNGEASAKKLADYKANVTAALKKKLGNDSNDYIINNVVNSTEFDTSKDVASIVDSVEQSYNAEYKKCFGNSKAPTTPQPGGAAGRTDEQNARLNSFKDRMRSRGALPPKESKD